jgi:hypothetical protein
VIDDPAIRERLLPASYDQRQVVDASHLVVFAAKVNFGEADLTAHVNRVAEVRGVTMAELALEPLEGRLISNSLSAARLRFDRVWHHAKFCHWRE